MTDKAELRNLIADYKPHFGADWRYSSRKGAFFRRDRHWVQIVDLYVSRWGGAYIPTNALEFLLGTDVGRTCHYVRLENRRVGLDRWIRKVQHAHRLEEIVGEMREQFRPKLEEPFDSDAAIKVVLGGPQNWKTAFMECVLAIGRLDAAVGRRYREECLRQIGSQEFDWQIEAIATLDRYLEMMDRPEELRATLAEVEERNWAAFLKWAGLKR